MMFGSNRRVAVQDPSYPAYVDSSVMIGTPRCTIMPRSSTAKSCILPVVQRMTSFLNLDLCQDAELIFFCSPEQPYRRCRTRDQLIELVRHAKETGSIIIYDAAYSIYISNPNCPKTIFEIPGADECCIETCSFSKYPWVLQACALAGQSSLKILSSQTEVW